MRWQELITLMNWDDYLIFKKRYLLNGQPEIKNEPTIICYFFTCIDVSQLSKWTVKTSSEENHIFFTSMLRELCMDISIDTWEKWRAPALVGCWNWHKKSPSSVLLNVLKNVLLKLSCCKNPFIRISPSDLFLQVYYIIRKGVRNTVVPRKTQTRNHRKGSNQRKERKGHVDCCFVGLILKPIHRRPLCSVTHIANVHGGGGGGGLH